MRLKNNEFNVYEEINNCKKEIEKRKTNKDPSLENCAIEDKIINILKLYSVLFDNYINNKLFFLYQIHFMMKIKNL